MDFVSLQNEVLSDRFDESKRLNSKNWINYRYGRLWGMQPWTFKFQISTLAVPLNATTVSRGSIGRILALWDASLTPNYQAMQALRPEDFHGAASLNQGSPYNWTIIGDNIIFANAMSSAKNFLVVNEKIFTPLVADANVPLIPDEFHLVLAAGAASHGLRLENDPSWESFEDDWNNGINDMKMNYLTSVETFSDSYPAWP